MLSDIELPTIFFLLRTFKKLSTKYLISQLLKWLHNLSSERKTKKNKQIRPIQQSTRGHFHPPWKMMAGTCYGCFVEFSLPPRWAKIIVENKKSTLSTLSGFPWWRQCHLVDEFHTKKTNKMCTYLEVVAGRGKSPSNYDFDDKCRNELVLKDFYWWSIIWRAELKVNRGM